jgi:hypothetical protein
LSAGTLLASPRGDPALVWPGWTPTGPELYLAKFDAASQKWDAPKPIMGGAVQENDVTASLRADGDLVMAFSQIAVITETTAGPDGPPVVLPALADSASLAVAELPDVFGPAPTAASPLAALALAGVGCVVLLGLATLGLVLLRLRRRRGEAR